MKKIKVDIIEFCAFYMKIQTFMYEIIIFDPLI